MFSWLFLKFLLLEQSLSKYNSIKTCALQNRNRLSLIDDDTNRHKIFADAINAIPEFAPNVEMYLLLPKQFGSNTILNKGERIHVVVCPLVNK